MFKYILTAPNNYRCEFYTFDDACRQLRILYQLDDYDGVFQLDKYDNDHFIETLIYHDSRDDYGS